MSSIEVTGSKSELFNLVKGNNHFPELLQQAAFYSIVEEEYIDQSPAGSIQHGSTQELRGQTRSTKIDGGFSTKSHAKNRGRSYPLFLHEGTGRLRGARDYGFTHGRVRHNDVAYGIGGIRPNKFAFRASQKVTPRVIKFYTKMVNREIERQAQL